MDYRTLLNRFLKGNSFLERLLSGPRHDFINPALANLHTTQIEQGFLSALIAHVLFLPVEHHYRFQPGATPDADG